VYFVAKITFFAAAGSGLVRGRAVVSFLERATVYRVEYSKRIINFKHTFIFTLLLLLLLLFVCLFPLVAVIYSTGFMISSPRFITRLFIRATHFTYTHPSEYTQIIVHRFAATNKT
jgi:hypothetical protein